MDRRYVSLRPRQPAETGPEESRPFEFPEVKRRRMSVSVACNTCRRRKVRVRLATVQATNYFITPNKALDFSNMSWQCDGQHPVCNNCLGSTNQCDYRDESTLSHESRKLVVELVRILNSIPDAEALRTLKLLSTETNAPIILSTLRDEAVGRDKSSLDPLPAATTPGASELLEFELQNPTAYPSVPPFDPKDLEKEPYVTLRSVTQDRRQYMTLCS